MTTMTTRGHSRKLATIASFALALAVAGCGGDAPPATRSAPVEYRIETFAGTGVPGTPLDNLPAAQAPLRGPTNAQVDDWGTVYIADQEAARFVLRETIHTMRATTDLGRIHDLSVSGVLITHESDGSTQRTGPILFISSDQAMSWYIASKNGPRLGEISYPTDLRGFVGALFDVSVHVGSGAAGGIYMATTDDPVLRAGRPGRTGAAARPCDLNEGAAATFGCIGFAGRMAIDGRPAPVVGELLDLYACDPGNHRVRKITWTGIWHTLAGGGGTNRTGDAARGFAGDGGPAERSLLDDPQGVAFDEPGNVYIADNGNHRVRMIDTDGFIHTIAGNGAVGFAGDGGPATDASFCSLGGLSVDKQGNVYVADTCNYRVRVLRPLAAAAP